MSCACRAAPASPTTPLAMRFFSANCAGSPRPPNSSPRSAPDPWRSARPASCAASVPPRIGPRAICWRHSARSPIPGGWCATAMSSPAAGLPPGSISRSQLSPNSPIPKRPRRSSCRSNMHRRRPSTPAARRPRRPRSSRACASATRRWRRAAAPPSRPPPPGSEVLRPLDLSSRRRPGSTEPWIPAFAGMTTNESPARMSAGAGSAQSSEVLMLYRGMDRAQLDAAYNNSAAVPARDAIIAGWAARSAAIRRERTGHFDLGYGAAPRERLDLFLAADPNAPTLLFIHGGYWQSNDKETFAFLAEGPVPNGINLALVEYTLAPAARMDRIVAELRRSALWLAEHLGDYGADPDRLYVAGHSAGGHLTATTMTLRAVRGGIAISGIFDLEPIRLNYLNEKLGLDPEEAERNSPLLHLPPMAGELVVAYGNRELPELCRQSIEYAQAWTERGLPSHLLPVDGADHFTILDALADPQGALTQALLGMIAG